MPSKGTSIVLAKKLMRSTLSRLVAIINYGSGNVHSVQKAFESVSNPDDKVILTKDKSHIKDATHIVLPGVGAFADCMKGLQRADVLEILEERVLDEQVPFLGICVGMQLLANVGHEGGYNQGLGWISGEVVPIDSKKGLRVPHMGWNDLQQTCDNYLTVGVDKQDMYFVHSYHFATSDEDNVLATVNYGDDIVAVVNKDNIYGVQFHPEKSQNNGLKLIKNFLAIT